MLIEYLVISHLEEYQEDKKDIVCPTKKFQEISYYKEHLYF